MLNQSVPEGLNPLKGTHNGTAHEGLVRGKDLF